MNKNNNSWTPERKKAFAEKMTKSRLAKKGENAKTILDEAVNKFEPLFETKKTIKKTITKNSHKEGKTTTNQTTDKNCKKCKVEITASNGVVYPETKYCIVCYDGIIKERTKGTKVVEKKCSKCENEIVGKDYWHNDENTIFWCFSCAKSSIKSHIVKEIKTNEKDNRGFMDRVMNIKDVSKG